MSCLTILGVEMQAVEVHAQKHQHTPANLDGIRSFEAYSQLPLYDVEKEVQHWVLRTLCTLPKRNRIRLYIRKLFPNYIYYVYCGDDPVPILFQTVSWIRRKSPMTCRLL